MAGCRIAAMALLGVVVHAAWLAAPADARQQTANRTSSTLIVFLRGERIGSEDVALSRGADGWTITSSGNVGPPLDLAIRESSVRYSADWRPIELRIEAAVRGQPLTTQTTVSGTTAVTRFTQGGQPGERTDTIAADALLLPSPFWGPFEALAQRLRTAPEGSSLPAFAGGLAFTIDVGPSAEEMIQTTAQLIRARRTSATLLAPGAPLEIAVWGDENGRLLRLSVPAQNLEVAREDVASVATRRVTTSRPNDEAVRVPANGFNLAATVSKPAASTAKQLPAVILVAGSGPQDRDETVFGIPVFGQLADRLADAGLLVLRYDKRGVGQSGGRIESATLADYAEDLRAAVRLVSERRDVNRRHVAVIGHSEGGAVALLAAARERRITALVLISAIGVTGAELNMAQVAHGMERSKLTQTEREATIALQKKIQTAVLTGKGWEEVPEMYRRQAEAPWFKSFLSFEPARLMPDVRPPILIVQPLLDKQVDPVNADALEKLARARRRGGPVEVVKVPDINHLLVPAVTGEVDEYASLKDKTVSQTLSAAIIDWLKRTFASIR
jgi:alpha-beta hydrolase superfamily lysophospholipase